MEDKLFFNNKRQLLIIIMLIIVMVNLTLFFWEGRQGFSLWDEGFLWYGAQRVLMGEIPFRDFMSYDIGRYYWSATLMSILNDNGILALRMSAMLFQTIALCIGLYVVVRSSTKQDLVFWLLAIFTLVLWMPKPQRMFDFPLSIFMISALSFLVEKPNIWRYFLTGLIVGFIAVFGRNHGVYGVLGSISVMIYLAARHEKCPSMIKNLSFWSLGVVVGYLPVLVFLVVVPGFAAAFWESIRALLFELKATNISLPVPWPWLVPFSKLSQISILRDVLGGVFFISLILFAVLGIFFVITKSFQNKPVSPTLIACVFLAFPYAHYAFSRADLEHLSLGIPPLLMGVFAFLASRSLKIKLIFAELLCCASILVMLPEHPGMYCYSSKECVEFNISGDRLKINKKTAEHLAMLNNLAERFAPSGQTFIATPFWPGAYAALERKSPMWEIYAIWPRSTAFQLAEIERIKKAKPGFSIIIDYSLDGREDLHFRNTHPVIYKYIRDNFKHINTLPQNIEIYISNTQVKN